MKTIFKNELAQRLFNEIKSNPSVYECGIDNKGMVYFAWMNGNIERYTRKAFIEKARNYYEL